MHEQHNQIAGLQTCSIRSADVSKLTIVFLHGYGMDAADLTPFAHSLAIPGAAYVFPQAPLKAMGRGHAWWPMADQESASARPRAARDLAAQTFVGREASRVLIRELVDTLLTQSAGEPLILAGFSQGGMLACDTVLMEGSDVAGLALMSSSCIAMDEWQIHQHRLRDLPAFVSHGREDPDLSFAAGERLKDCLIQGGASVTWVPFEGGHEIPFLVWRQFRRFAGDVLRTSIAH
jgi:phospholipase/carboxylesterase